MVYEHLPINQHVLPYEFAFFFPFHVKALVKVSFCSVGGSFFAPSRPSLTGNVRSPSSFFPVVYVLLWRNIGPWNENLGFLLASPKAFLLDLGADLAVKSMRFPVREMAVLFHVSFRMSIPQLSSDPLRIVTNPLEVL